MLNIAEYLGNELKIIAHVKLFAFILFLFLATPVSAQGGPFCTLASLLVVLDELNGVQQIEFGLVSCKARAPYLLYFISGPYNLWFGT